MIRGIIKKLKDTTEVTTLVDADNIFPVVAKQDTPRPYVTVRRTGETGQVVKNQASDTDQTVFNVTVYSDKYKESVDILYAVRTALEAIRDETIQTVKFKRVWYDNTQDLFDKEDLSFVVVDTYIARWSRL